METEHFRRPDLEGGRGATARPYEQCWRDTSQLPGLRSGRSWVRDCPPGKGDVRPAAFCICGQFGPGAVSAVVLRKGPVFSIRLRGAPLSRRFEFPLTAGARELLHASDTLRHRVYTIINETPGSPMPSPECRTLGAAPPVWRVRQQEADDHWGKWVRPTFTIRTVGECSGRRSYMPLSAAPMSTMRLGAHTGGDRWPLVENGGRR